MFPLCPDGTAQPQSRTNSTDGITRPNSKNSSRAAAEELLRKDDYSGPFRDFTDYSKQNADKHKTSRADISKSGTLGRGDDTLTKSGTLSRTLTSPRSKLLREASSNIPQVVYNSEDASSMMGSINSSYLISGIRHEVREIGKDLKTEVHKQLEQTLLQVRNETQAALSTLSDTRDSTIGIVMAKLKEGIHSMLTEAGWPLDVDFSPVFQKLRASEATRCKEHEDMTQALEEKFGQLRRLHETKEEELQQSNERLLEEMQLVRNEFTTLETDLAKTHHTVQEVRHDLSNQHVILERRLEENLARHVSEQPVNVDFSEVFSYLTQLKACQRFPEVLSGLEDIQGSLSHVKGEIKFLSLAEKRKSEEAKQTCEEMWTQTDVVETIQNFAQTDDKFWRAKVQQKTKTTDRSKSQVQRDQTINTVAVALVPSRKEKTGVFVDAESMRKKARQALIKPQHTIAEHYHTRGIAQKLARRPFFEQMTFVMVVINAIWIAVDADYNDANLLIQAHPVFQVVDNLFCCYFFGELAIRFAAFRRKKRFFKDGWCLFDLGLVIFMVLETWVMSVIFLVWGYGKSGAPIDATMLRLIRIVKIVRLSRLARLVRAVPEIVVFLKGIGAAARSVGSLFGLWSIIIYVFALFFVQALSDDTKSHKFQTVPEAMNTLLLDGILPQNSGLVSRVASDNFLFWPVMVGFVLLATITLSYMLIGVLVQIIQVISVAEKERAVVGVVASHLRHEWMDRFDDADTLLAKADFQSLLIEPQIAQFLQDVGVDVLVLVDLSDMIFDDIAKEKNGISFEDFVDAVLNMRGANPVTVQDVKSQLRIVKRLIKESAVNLENQLQIQFTKCIHQTQRVLKAVRGEDDLEDFDGSDTDTNEVESHGDGDRTSEPHSSEAP